MVVPSQGWKYTNLSLWEIVLSCVVKEVLCHEETNLAGLKTRVLCVSKCDGTALPLHVTN